MLDVKAKNKITSKTTSIWRKEIYYMKVKCHIKLFKDLINPPPRSGEGIIGMHFVCLSVRLLSVCNISCPLYNLHMH